jgi:ornithine decarboxylase
MLHPFSETALNPTRYPSIEALIAARKPERPLYCWHPDPVRQAVRGFIDGFPGDTLYAVKCNPHPYLLRLLYESGIRHFDTASLNEIKLIKDNFPDAACYFMHPVKGRAAIREAYEKYGVTHLVVDHPNELQKIREEIPIRETTIYVRIAPPSTVAVFDFSKKFGADVYRAIELLRLVKDSGAKSAISFHIGSQCLIPEIFVKTLAMVKQILKESRVDLEYLDIGGGFPAAYRDVKVPRLSEYFERIEEGLQILDLPKRPQLLCEPGRALSVEGASIVAQVQLRKGDALHLNDGIYGHFAEIIWGKFGLPVRLVRPGEDHSPINMDFTVYGPTCDSVDVLPIPFRLPVDTREGDWIEVGLIGAYSNATSTPFNGFYIEETDFVEVPASSFSQFAAANAA